MSEKTVSYAWRLASGDFICHKKNNERNMILPATPYVNNATFYPCVNSAMFNDPNGDKITGAELYKITVMAEKVSHDK